MESIGIFTPKTDVDIHESDMTIPNHKMKKGSTINAIME